ncbi:S-type pyocin domain-containing protein [Pseudomonas sp. MRSN 12121]|uniref:S-type pyocin domain-containing protein n=1 Tax=Pseudomonas sp. MRSN 12121 TaxID=1611770 RepID=UPI0005BE9F14|nr:S-type pyocin domain-containing protein [Pseudomonas sp. MRSN 12121]AJO79650.1 pyocin [Pseudomonas sp. MRSN 12121]
MSGYVPNLPKGYRNKGVDPVDIGARRWAEYKDLAPKPDAGPPLRGCVFAKSRNLPDGEISHRQPAGFVPVEPLADYGIWAVLGTGIAIAAESTSLQWVGGSASAGAIAERLGGSLALSLSAAAGSVAASAAVGTLVLLMPNTRLAPDSAFYTADQYAQLDMGRTRVRINVKTLPDGSVNAYGFYTGGKRDWENVPVIEATKDGERYVANICNGIDLIWTPAANPDAVLGIPALEGVRPLPLVWVYPPTAQSDTLLHNPEHPPEFQDAIIWFPAGAGLEPIYVVLSTQLEKNKQNGKDFEDNTYDEYSVRQVQSGREVTVRTKSGIRTRFDMLGRDVDGKLSCVECKSSATAPLTRNQKVAFPEIEESGATIVGKGKTGFPGGTEIPPTKVEIVRPKP